MPYVNFAAWQEMRTCTSEETGLRLRGEEEKEGCHMYSATVRGI